MSVCQLNNTWSVVPTVGALFTIVGVNSDDTTLAAVIEATMVLTLTATGQHVKCLNPTFTLLEFW